MKKNRGLVSLILGAAAAVSMSVVFSTTAYASKPTSNRYYGANRYATNASIVNNGWTEAPNVVIASGENYPDALSAAPFAQKKNAPIILVEKSGLSSDQIKQLTNLKTKDAYIIGGTGVVSNNAETQLGALGIAATRIAGNNRYETSVKIAQEVGTANGVVVASGENFPDALSIAPIAAAKGMPILLSPKDSLPDSAKNFLQGKNVFVTYMIGGTGVLNDNVKASLKNAVRLFGKDRYETNLNVIMQFENSLNFNSIYVASGDNFPDALSGSVFASNSKAPIALVGVGVPADSSDYLKTKNIMNINLLGGTGAVSTTVENNLKDTMKYSAVKKVDDVTDVAFINEKYNFPSKAIVTYEDNSEKLMPVKWNSDIIDTSKEGVFTYSGTVDGYDKNINLVTRIIKETGDNHQSLSTGGFMAYYKENYYYSNPSDGNKLYVMTYKANEDGIKLSDDSPAYINVVYDKIYYINKSDHNYIYRINLDGTQRVKLIDTPALRLVVNDDKLYYSVVSLDVGTGIYRTDLDGNNKVKLNNESSYDMSIKDDYLYFADTRSDIYKMKLDGSGKVSVGDASGGYINIEDGWIYYISNWKIYKIKTDGTNKTKVSDVNAESINVYNGWIYYMSPNTNTLNKIRIDGTEQMELASKVASDNIYDSGDYIFYLEDDMSLQLHSARVDGSYNFRIAIPYIHDKEPNNDLASSQQYRLQYGNGNSPIVEGTIEKYDVDVYKLGPLYTESALNIYINAPTIGSDVVIELLDESGNVIYSNYTDSNGETDIVTDRIQGTEYVKVFLRNPNTAPSTSYYFSAWIGPW